MTGFVRMMYGVKRGDLGRWGNLESMASVHSGTGLFVQVHVSVIPTDTAFNIEGT